MQLKALLAYLHEFIADVEENPMITSLEMDSRNVTEGSLFFCIEGYTVDGHAYAKQAELNGAAALIVEKDVSVGIPTIKVKSTKRAMAILADAFYRQPTQKLHLIGVTGTNGKTSTTHIIDKIMSDFEQKTGLIGTMYIKIGETTLEVKNTTPESLTLQQTFHRMVEENVETAIMEVSSHALDLGRVHGCDFDVAVFTNLTQDHLDYHQSMDEYRHAKGLLFAGLGNAFNHKNPKFAVLNADDPASTEYIKSTAATIITYGIDTKSDIMATNLQMTSFGTVFELVTPFETVSVSIKLIGKFSVYNVLAAIATCLVSNIPLSQIVRSVGEIEGIAGRFEVVNGGQNFTVVVDYAHTPDSLENVLTTVNQLAKGRTIVVVGCGGDRDRTKRPLMANIAVKNADLAIFTSDNPRSEDPAEILREMEAGVDEQHYVSMVDRAEAINYAISQAREHDIIVIAGKGHETYQIIGDKTHKFDDRLVAMKAIKELS
ncbi:UDP-N-acetylmuramoyl-L-alanyl-D-glutamate--2,6-diaminopimelate ligase [Bacillus sp. PS06]|uniref:UDP-N-acetylmuramoyl-L-alanyl-D-glutamate--2, 6-diaminopimelate ligase n=1 Tax=Bacillus sp. PS06 TaxID=2764176 RepID=UPI0017835AF2|nr:UDP-N-acetylmuramoyl-L-alanyl-D-glutamate--2,6-diaminopimelate ligase [Bacillus sp. PS06]MBD8068394.1 UDP-N-acetylmuramoyl-L-alanyl-D-glutamate--2,6-diaminopimelate ligase [Bacillus sp. PS06]